MKYAAAMMEAAPTAAVVYKISVGTPAPVPSGSSVGIVVGEVGTSVGLPEGVAVGVGVCGAVGVGVCGVGVGVGAVWKLL